VTPPPADDARAPRGAPVFSRETTLAALDRLFRVLAREGVEIPAPAGETIATFLESLFRTSAHTNLVARNDLPEIVDKHVAPSVVPLLAEEVRALPEGTRVLDIGSGGGFPGAVLAGVRPSWDLTLVESIRKKAKFLADSTASWGNVHVRAERAEMLGGEPGFRGSFSLVTARAVAPPDMLWPLARPFLGAAGQLHVWVPRAAEHDVSERMKKHRDVETLPALAAEFYPGLVMRFRFARAGRISNPSAGAQ